MRRKVSGWGRSPVVETDWLEPSDPAGACTATREHEGLIARGAGRAYGDAALGATTTLAMTGLDRMLAFDADTGLLSAEAGVRLGDIIACFLPRGWFPPVVPGTRHVTLGGAIAADVHGKNHHRDGGFGQHVESLTIALPDGRVETASRTVQAPLFFHTLGGMGLTGTILSASLRLRRVETGWIRQTTRVAENLADALRALDATDSATYSVAWIDGVTRGANLGRALVFAGEHATRAEIGAREPFPRLAAARLAVPVDLPGFALSRLSVAAFNEAYFRLGARKAGPSFLVPAGPYFFPLDGVEGWNRIYGSRGFVQHQCVLPPAGASEALHAMLALIAERGNASFLAVLKKLGPAPGTLSFPFPGYTLALDFPVEPGLDDFMTRLDAIVVAAGGRMYLAKDSRQSRATFEAGYPGLDVFRAFRREIDPERRLQSQLSLRLGL